MNQQQFKGPVDQVAGRDVINIIQNPVTEIKPRCDWYCPHCDMPIKRGNTVCRGCQADIVYGSTKRERKQNLLIAAAVVSTSAFFSIVGLPIALNEMLDYDIPNFWDLPTYVTAAIVVVSGLAAGLFCAITRNASRLKKPPRFIRPTKR